jgi:hypothetical protein
MMYIRMEAEHLLDQCLLDFDSARFNRLLEELVLAGSGSILVLREILTTILNLKANLTRAELDLREDLVDALAEFGVRLSLQGRQVSGQTGRSWSQALDRELRSRTIGIGEDEKSLLQEICIESGKQATLIAQRLVLLSRLEESVRDWIDGLAYVIARSPDEVLWTGNPQLKQ